MKRNLAKYMLFVYTHYIGDCESDIFKKYSHFFLKPAYIINAILMYLLSIPLFPFILFHMKYEEDIKTGIDEYKSIVLENLDIKKES